MLSEKEVIEKLKYFYNAIVDLKAKNKNLTEKNESLAQQNASLIQEKEYLNNALSAMKKDADSNISARQAFDTEMMKIIAEAEEVLKSDD